MFFSLIRRFLQYLCYNSVYMVYNTILQKLTEELMPIGELKEILGRVDERLKTVAENQNHLSERFEKFLELHMQLSDRVKSLETLFDVSRVDEVDDNYNELRT